ACAIALVVALSSPGEHGAVAPTGRPRAMSAVVASTVHASAILTTVGWGTQIELDCRYDAQYSSRISGATYSLVVVDRREQAHLAGSWALVPGQVTHFVSGTALARDQIARIEIVAGSSPILALTL
ncbi:MAG: hypothetical protein M3O28_05565, partial [Actinomycetota bacterium]|nr:hypothetical protein [Actinomycetota bacterium]